MQKDNKHIGAQFVLAFANSLGGKNYLKALKMERDQVRDSLEEARRNKILEYKILPDASLRQIWETFNHRHWNNQVQVFHYGGHGEEDVLWLEDEQDVNDNIHFEGFTEFIAKQKELKLVFFNACLSQQMGQYLVDLGMPVVIGSRGMLNDKISSEFSAGFYSSLTNGDTIQLAFDKTKALVEAKYREQIQDWIKKRFHNKRTFEDGFPWVLLHKPDTDIHTTWSVNQYLKEEEPEEEEAQPTQVINIQNMQDGFFGNTKIYNNSKED